MVRSIAAAATVFGIAAFALHSLSLGTFEEPLLLLAIGTLFLCVGKLLAGREAPELAEPGSEEPQLLPERHRTPA
jgi:hypothetical protein